MDLGTLTIAEARRALDAKEYSALDLTNAYLDAIAQKDGEIHAYLEVWADSARQEAKAADTMIAAGKSQALTGIPLAFKDNMLIEGRIASSASRILENYVASYDATVISKLKAQGVVFLGRTNMDEFALGSSTENSAYGPTKNPHDTSRVPGGTSGGSTAAVAACMALGALGSDTGGSIRQPAALCGVVGFKPTYGAVSRSGLMAAASSLDQIGTIGKTVGDAEVLYRRWNIRYPSILRVCVRIARAYLFRSPLPRTLAEHRFFYLSRHFHLWKCRAGTCCPPRRSRVSLPKEPPRHPRAF